MVGQLSEADLEDTLLQWFSTHGWTAQGDSNADGAKIFDEEYSRDEADPAYWNLLREKLITLNTDVTRENVEEVLTRIKAEYRSGDLITVNQNIHQLITNGLSIKLETETGETERVNVSLIDFDDPEANEFTAVNQFRYRSSEGLYIPDIVLLVNGLPVVIGEVKASTKGNTVQDAIVDLQEYEREAPRMFGAALCNIAFDSMQFRTAAVGASRQHYHPWRPDEELDAAEYEDERRAGIASLLSPGTLLDVIENYVFYYEDGGTEKIVARYMQYYAAGKIIGQIKSGERDSRLIWHTQGSGKSLTMLFVARYLLDADWFPTPQILILVDADELRDQFDNDLQAIGFGRYEKATSQQGLYDMIETGTSKVIVTTIQLFEEAEPDLQSNENTVILADEAHRFLEKKLGNRLKGALSDQYYFGFTGTPVEGDERNTFLEFADLEGEDVEPYLDRYSIEEGIRDEVILPVHFTVRSDIQWEADFESMDEEFEGEFSHLPEEDRMKALRETVTARELSQIWPRVNAVSQDIVQHFEEFVRPEWKGMVVAASRRAAARYGVRLQELLGEDAVEVLYTSMKDDDEELRQFETTAEERESIVTAFKHRDPEGDDNPKILVVCNMLLTGFDAPILKTIYLDDPMQGHRLLQAIARVNRTAPGRHKGHGEVVDYQGVLSNVEEALEYEDEVIQEHALSERGELLDDFVDVLEEIEAMFDEPEQGQEAQHTLINQVAKEPERSQFKRKVRELQNLFEAIAPSDELVPYEDRYDRVLAIYTGLRSVEGGNGGRVSSELKSKTLEFIEENSDIKEIRHNHPRFRLSAEVLEEIDDDPEEVHVVKKSAELEQELSEADDRNPQYERLSERVRKVLEQWNSNELETSGAWDALERIEQEIETVETEADKLDLDEAEYAIYLLLDGEYEDELASTPRELAQAIGSAFDEEIDTSYPRWRTSQKTRKNIQGTVSDTLVTNNELELYGDEEFIAECVRYLTQNK